METTWRKAFLDVVIFVAFIAAYISLGTWSVVEILSWFNISIPLLASVIIGMFAGEISIPIAVIFSILESCGWL